MAASMQTSLFHFYSSPLDDAKSKDITIIQDRYFNHALTIILPGVSGIPNTIFGCFSDQIAYKLHNLSLYRLIEMPFIHAFVKKGGLHITSVNTKLDTDNTIVVTPSGWLLLHLTKDTYQELGIEAAKQTHSDKKSDNFVVKINLLADHFRPGKKGYERVLWCLKEKLNLTFDLLVAWEPHDENVCSSSIAVYFSEKCSKVERIHQQRLSRVFTSLPCPKIDFDQPEGSEIGCHYREVFDWMGALACGVDMNSEDIGPDSYTSTFTCPEPAYNCPRVCVFQISGFFTPQTVVRLWKELREHASSHPECLPASLTVHGFSDCCVSYRLAPHSFYISGDNLYSLVLLPNNKYWSYVAAVS